MMIPLSRLVNIALFFFLLASNLGAGVISPALLDRIRAISPDSDVPVIITLVDKVDVGRISGKGRKARLEQIVRALKDKSQNTQGPLLSFLAGEGGRQIRSLWIINAISAVVPSSVVNHLMGFPGVERIELDGVIYAPVVTLADPSFPEWNISVVHAPDLWALGYRGQGIVVASMDTGVDVTHPDLTVKWRGGTNSWFDPNGEHASPFDATGHGTLTMGIMVGGDAGGTSIGVAPDAQWVAVKIFNDSGTASYSAIHAGFQWILDPDGDPATDDAPDVVNNSWGFDQNPGLCITEFEADIQALKSSGIAVVFSAGNSGPSTSTSVSPANNEGSFSVGAVDSDNVVWQFSSRGPSPCSGGVFPHIVAPGVSIRSSDLSFGGMTNYSIVTGTSASAPHVSGGMAILKQAFPNMSPSKLEWAMAVAAIDLGVPGLDNDYGNGMIDLLATYDLVSQPETIGVFRNGVWYLDVNGNGGWDPATDMHIEFGTAGDIPVAGDWNGSGTTKIGVFRNGAWYRDVNGNGGWDAATEPVRYFGTTGDIPVVGDWNGTGTAKVGVFRNGTWYMDVNGNGGWDPGTDIVRYFGTAGDIPVVGDWNGSGTSKIGVFRNGAWYLDGNGDGGWDETVIYFGTAGDIPVVGDWNGTAVAKIGVFRNGVWYLDVNGNGGWDNGVDAIAYFGTRGDGPVSGKW